MELSFSIFTLVVFIITLIATFGVRKLYDLPNTFLVPSAIAVCAIHALVTGLFAYFVTIIV